MKAIILAAGRGSRMGDLTADRPKCLLEWQGRPLIEWQIETLKSAGVTQIGIVTGYKNELINKYNLKIFHNSSWESTNMVASLKCAEEWLANEVCIVAYADIIYKATPIEQLIESDAELAISYDPNWHDLWKMRFNDVLSDAESFDIDENNFLIDIGRKVNSIELIKGQYMGLLRIAPTAWRYLMEILDRLDLKQQRKIAMTELLNLAIKKHAEMIKCIDAKSAWFEIDSEEDYKTLTMLKLRAGDYENH